MQQRTLSQFFAALFARETSLSFGFCFGLCLTACLSIGALSLGGCTLLLDTEKVQCSKSSDCIRLEKGSNTGLLCEQGFCQQASCGESEAGASDPKQADMECAAKPGLKDYVCEDRVCVAPKCKSAADCKEVGESASCVMGRCEDVTWGCVGQPDDREVPASGTATLNLRILDVSNSPIAKDGGLVINVCSVPGGGSCIKLSNAKPTYDYTTGVLSITGLRQKQRFWLQISADGFNSVDWYTQRPPVGETTEAEPAVLVPAGLETMLANQFKPPIVLDLDNASTMIIRSYNCKGESGEGVSFDVTKALANTKIFYIDASYMVLLENQATGPTGTGGIANARTEPIAVTAKRGAKAYPDFAITPRPRVLTYIALYPSDYSN